MNEVYDNLEKDLKYLKENKIKILTFNDLETLSEIRQYAGGKFSNNNI